MSDPIVVCEATASKCICGEPRDHELPHKCSQAHCGGEWVGNYADDTFEVVTFPSGLAGPIDVRADHPEVFR